VNSQEIIARTIHEEYLRDQAAKGETGGSNPTLVPWDELPEKEKEKDRNPVRKIPDFLAKAGSQIYRKGNNETTF